MTTEDKLLKNLTKFKQLVKYRVLELAEENKQKYNYCSLDYNDSTLLNFDTTPVTYQIVALEEDDNYKKNYDNNTLLRFLSIKPVYTAEATAQGGRNGKVKTSDGLINLDLTTPKGLGGPGLPGKTNPEQLFACGYAACFRGNPRSKYAHISLLLGSASAMGPAAKQFNTELPDTTTVTGVVHIGPDAQNKLGLAVELKVHVPGIDKKVVEAIVEAADQVSEVESFLSFIPFLRC
ncbi:OsmC/Ohr family [Jimgerdemannia flammicorona]|uniref:OsmC/Ohr family n=1 Tax=Jimgerdemannia flammicorona TaxID=994334 RepID=A0A433QCM2_9FUNG|nr:OsmC/Ohr family [Jimgerdemannia flammicorona]